MSRKLLFTEQDIDVMARTMWGEARGEGALGMQAVANVIANRAAISEEKGSYWWGNGIEGVAKRFRGDQHQFSCWDESDPNYKKIMALTDNDPTFVMAKRIARGVLSGSYYDNTEGAEHFRVRSASVEWANPAQVTARIKNHIFENKSGYDPRDLRDTGRMMASNTSFYDLFGKKEQPLPAASLAARHGGARIALDLPEEGLGQPIVRREEVYPEYQREQAAIMLAQIPPELIARPEQITFEKGYTVNKMAADLGIDKPGLSKFYAAFMEANPQVRDIDKVNAGVAYNVPSFQKDADPAAVATVATRLNPSDVLKSHGDEDIYVVRKGDRLVNLFNGNLEAANEYAKANNIDPRKLQEGQELRGIPAPTLG